MLSGSFAGKTALVTGASRGIGRELVKSLIASNIDRVYALCKLSEGLNSLKTEFPNHVEVHHVDITDWSRTQEILNDKIPHVDCLVNNAGFVDLVPVGMVTESTINDHFDVNVKAVVNLTQLVAEKMIATRNGGSIVNISSQASTIALKDHLAYCASKAALDGLTRVFALELGPHQIRVNSIRPTVTMTDMARKAWFGNPVSNQEQSANPVSKASQMLSRIPLGRFAESSDVVSAALFLLSDNAKMINGAFLPVDGGYSAC